MDFAFNQNLIAGYHGRTQMARVLTEDWVARNIYCPVCGNVALHHYEANKPVADFCCEACRNDFELKSKEKESGDLGKVIKIFAHKVKKMIFFSHLHNFDLNFAAKKHDVQSSYRGNRFADVRD